ncbi:hypothetical protein FPQ18DRAFT_304000 [Pyronema domesticum]|nr:hypothetical protein FPQ18DRAFT_304000 [Pyronema domesticum]
MTYYGQLLLPPFLMRTNLLPAAVCLTSWGVLGGYIWMKQKQEASTGSSPGSGGSGGSSGDYNDKARNTGIDMADMSLTQFARCAPFAAASVVGLIKAEGNKGGEGGEGGEGNRAAVGMGPGIPGDMIEKETAVTGSMRTMQTTQTMMDSEGITETVGGSMGPRFGRKLGRGVKRWAESLETVDGMGYGLPGSMYG